jgi:hypothetical protein
MDYGQTVNFRTPSTNYMMLEYLLVRPSDREAIFANHRCRFLVLDEVHTYRGILGSNIAMLVRRLRAHRFIRGGWQFHRCINPDCGKLYPMGEEKCSACHYDTAPLYLCRNCGADYLRLVGDPDAPLRPSARPDEGPEWMVYEPDRFEGVGAGRRP